ncbi:hypothetical protein N7462_002556 [Penicillium macrosclerotiorum]|uniref:uncharacterized protein n=1 Tax=Penicillium macrosclerotiorum TaxID=303699 RepID=UPI00254935D2|nr:uncharacterized protein N7462_002556 [Penicillium macrosclerotiorum]KAJ5693133.1 hypothetical protein N7462_002556 [Penicillium macrosclerotiorum]
MAPIRRYLRISKYSVIECRIYLDNPSNARWLLDPRDPVLSRVFAAIRPLVLPKLREENERLWARKKGKPVKDVIAEDEFEVAIFLRESRTRHSLLTRNKTFKQSNTQKDSSENAREETNTAAESANPVNPTDTEIIIESDSEHEVSLHNVPEANEGRDTSEGVESSRQRRKALQADRAEAEGTNDEKKMGFHTDYESFNICSWVLCLLITRKGDRTRANVAAMEPKQPLMEEWISTQAATGLDED